MRNEYIISSKDKLKETWYRYNKYIILSVCLIIGLIIVLFLVFNKKDKGNRYQDIERIMIINAQNYIKNNNITDNCYVSLNNLNIKIGSELKCNNLSGVYKENDSYYPYLVCQDYKSESINDLIEENNNSKEYGELNGDALYFVVNDRYQDIGVKTDYQVNIKGDDIDNGLNVVTYYINDNGKNLGELKRIVIGEDIVGSIPVLTLVGEKTRTIPKGSTYNETGYNAIDERDGNITDKVKVSGNVDTSKPGTYKLIYSVTNSRNKVSKQERTIIVNESDDVDLKITHFLNPSEITKKDVTITIKVSGNEYKSIVLPDNSESKNSEVSYTVYKNGIYDFIVYDTNNNSEVYSVEVKNIKKDPPSGSCTVTYENNNERSVLVVNANDKGTISSYEIYNDDEFLIKQKTDSYSFKDYPLNTKVKMTDVISQSSTITCKIIDKDPIYVTSGSFRRRYNNKDYWLYIPKNANIHEKLPLIFFMHGANGKEQNMDDIAAVALPKYIKNGTMDSFNIKAIIVAPVLYSWKDENAHNRLINIIKHVEEEYNVDENRISLIGFSMGAYGGSYFIANYPNFFSSFVAVAGAEVHDNVYKSAKVPIRAYVGSLDNYNLAKVNRYAAKVKETGGNITVTILPGFGHVCTDEVFKNTDALKWAISQKRK